MKRRLAIGGLTLGVAMLASASAFAVRTASPFPVDFGTIDVNAGGTVTKTVTYTQQAGDMGGAFSASIVEDQSNGKIVWQTNTGTCGPSIPNGAHSCTVPVSVSNPTKFIPGTIGNQSTALLDLKIGTNAVSPGLKVSYVGTPNGTGGGKKKKCGKKKGKKSEASAAKKKKCGKK